MFRTLIRILLLLLICFVASSKPALAEGEFSTSINTVYTINNDGLTIVTQNMELTNNTETYYASEYSTTIFSTDLTNIEAHDTSGTIEVGVEKKSDQTTLTLPFNEKPVGKGAKLNFSLTYSSKDVAKILGNVKEIAIPKIGDSSDITSYTVTVKIPVALGQAVLINPQPKTFIETDGYYIYTFDKSQLLQSGAFITLGTEQYFQLNLKYHLSNPNNRNVFTQIALPPDLPPHQILAVKSLEPKPNKIETDTDGNTLATYNLEPGQNVDVTYEGVAHLVMPLRPKDNKETLEQIPQSIRDKYTVPLKFWESDNPSLHQIAQTETTNYDNVYDQSKALYTYVTKTLSYSKERLTTSNLERFGGLKALENKDQAVCLEYTDLLISLMRSVGIPAREIDGYAYTTDTENLPVVGDVLHAWVEFYSPGVGWVPVDPTWGSTTNGLDYFDSFDPQHLGFAVKGLSSEWPYPAGAYKISPDQTGDINVRFANPEEIDFFNNSSSEITVNSQTGKYYLSGTDRKVSTLIINSGSKGIIIPVVEIYLNAELKSTMNNLSVPAHSIIENSQLIGRERLWKTGPAQLEIKTPTTSLIVAQTDIPIIPLLILGFLGGAGVIWRYGKFGVPKGQKGVPDKESPHRGDHPQVPYQSPNQHS